MKILVLAPQPFFQNRGTPIAVRQLAEALAEEGHAVDLLAYHEGEHVPLRSVTLHRIPALLGIHDIRPGFSLKKVACDIVMFFKAMSLMRTHRYDLLHAVEESAFIALVIGKLFGVPYLFDMDSSLAQQMIEKYPHLQFMKRLLERAERRAVRSSVGVIAVCRSVERTALGYAPDLHVLRLEDVSLLPTAGTEPRGAALPKAPRPVVMYVGNLEPYQGLDLLLESFRVVLDEGQFASLVIIGGTRAHIRHYTDKARALGVAAHVFFHGPQPVEHLAAYLGEADVLVSPRIRGFNTPMKIYSYLDSGKPLAATRLPTHTQVLDDMIALLLAPEPRAFGGGLVRLLRDHDFAASLGRAGRARAREQFTQDAYRLKLASFYRDVSASVVNGHKAALR